MHFDASLNGLPSIISQNTYSEGHFFKQECEHNKKVKNVATSFLQRTLQF